MFRLPCYSLACIFTQYCGVVSFQVCFFVPASETGGEAGGLSTGQTARRNACLIADPVDPAHSRSTSATSAV
ncbi:hypothetical protein DSJ_08930 [Pantoea stewartii subsp. stewartii DC283]|uniref:Secreted protein n=1 Tax=Pantoea stewartii subsp. stewartii DC283 TaxID=660596 RepID=A0ABN4YXG7_PANSE|nr:hypothetical protein DSJ_08930 [Pantoea stewartii subsp. stewartii DC283]